jgi:hypothetical protein
MPQYSDSYTSPSGLVTTAVLDSTTNQITYTVSTPTGQTATTTKPVSEDQRTTTKNNTQANGELIAQLRAAGQTGGLGFNIAGVTDSVKEEKYKADKESAATNTPVPDAPSPPPPIGLGDPYVPPPPEGFAQIEGQAPGDNYYDTTGGATQAEQDAIIAAQQEAAAESYGGATQAEQDAIIQAQRNAGGVNAEGQNVTIRNPDGSTTNPETGVTTGSRSINANSVRSRAVAQTQRNARQQDDWRIRLQLAQQANYLYNTAKEGDLLYPLKATSGVIFPYTPQINISYKANYDPSDLTHTNYKQYFYKNSSVEEIQITADFTAQDTTEALYMLAVIHFFKSVTKMFYGQDANPRAGTPPPLCYLLGYGQYQFSDHPIVLTSFQYNLPTDVDYIRAGSTTQWAGQNVSAYAAKDTGSAAGLVAKIRALASKVPIGGISKDPTWNSLSNSAATYVPTKIQLSLNALPVVTRADIANNFSLEKYASGELLKRGIW